MEQWWRRWCSDTLKITSQERVQLHTFNMVHALGIILILKLDISYDMLIQLFEVYAVHTEYFQKNFLGKFKVIFYPSKC